MAYGKELILDLYNCGALPCDRVRLTQFFEELCNLIKMERADLHFWDYDDPQEYVQAPPHLKGISAVQFIKTSNITVHTLDELQQVFVNIFSCGEFDDTEVVGFTSQFFRGIPLEVTVLQRG